MPKYFLYQKQDLNGLLMVIDIQIISYKKFNSSFRRFSSFVHKNCNILLIYFRLQVLEQKFLGLRMNLGQRRFYSGEKIKKCRYSKIFKVKLCYVLIRFCVNVAYVLTLILQNEKKITDFCCYCEFGNVNYFSQLL